MLTRNVTEMATDEHWWSACRRNLHKQVKCLSTEGDVAHLKRWLQFAWVWVLLQDQTMLWRQELSKFDYMRKSGCDHSCH